MWDTTEPSVQENLNYVIKDLKDPLGLYIFLKKKELKKYW